MKTRCPPLCENWAPCRSGTPGQNAGFWNNSNVVFNFVCRFDNSWHFFVYYSWTQHSWKNFACRLQTTSTDYNIWYLILTTFWLFLTKNKNRKGLSHREFLIYCPRWSKTIYRPQSDDCWCPVLYSCHMILLIAFWLFLNLPKLVIGLVIFSYPTNIIFPLGDLPFCWLALLQNSTPILFPICEQQIPDFSLPQSGSGQVKDSSATLVRLFAS